MFLVLRDLLGLLDPQDQGVSLDLEEGLRVMRTISMMIWTAGSWPMAIALLLRDLPQISSVGAGEELWGSQDPGVGLEVTLKLFTFGSLHA